MCGDSRWKADCKWNVGEDDVRWKELHTVLRGGRRSRVLSEKDNFTTRGGYGVERDRRKRKGGV